MRNAEYHTHLPPDSLRARRSEDTMSTGKALLIVNPEAKHGETSKLLPVIERLLVDLAHDTVHTERPGHATELAANASGYDLVVACGGDGTVHEVLNGLMSIDEATRPTLGILPTGSGNDTRRTMGVSTDLAQAALQLVTGVRKRFDIGVCNGTYFNNSFAAGLDAKVTAKAVEYKVTTKRSGLWLYLTALLHVLFHDLNSFKMNIAFDSEPRQLHDTLIIAITQGPTYGGGFLITPDAKPDDGLFDVCMIDPFTLPEALFRLPFLIMGKHTRMKPVHMSRHTRISVQCDVPIPAQIDGEVLLQNHYEIEILPAAIECVVPGDSQ